MNRNKIHRDGRRWSRGRRGAARRWAGLSFAALTIGSVLVAAPAPAVAAGLGTYAFTGSAWGTSATLLDGTLSLGRSAFVSVGCTDQAGVNNSNTVASVDAAPLASSGTVTTTATTSVTVDSEQSQTTATTQGINLLNGAITADAVQANSTTSVDTSGFHTSAQGSNLVNLVIGGNSISASPAPNTVIQLPGLGRVVLNEETRKSGRSMASLTVNMIHVYITVQNSIADLGSDIIVSHAASDLEGPVAGVVDGKAYGTSVLTAGAITSGPSALVVLPCEGTNGAVLTNQVASGDLPDVATTGTVVDTAKGSTGPLSATSETTATVQTLNLLAGTVTVDAVTADAHARHSRDGRISTSDSGSQFANLSIAGHPEITSNPARDTQISLIGLGTLWLHRVIRGTNSIEVRMIELVVFPSNTHGLPPGLDIRIAVAEASVD